MSAVRHSTHLGESCNQLKENLEWEMLSRRRTCQSLTGGQGCHVGFQYMCVCVCVWNIRLEESYKQRGYCVGALAHGIFCCICASCSDKRGTIRAGVGVEKSMKWDVNFRLLSLLFINSSLCAFWADVPVTRSVTVSNELNSPLHLIYWTDPPSLPVEVSQLFHNDFMTS